MPSRRLLAERKALVDARAQGMARAVELWLRRFAASNRDRFIGGFIGKASVAEDLSDDPAADLEALILRFGLRTALDAAEDAGQVRIQGSLRTDALEGRFDRWPGLRDMKAAAAARSKEIVQETYDGINRAVRDELRASGTEFPAPATSEVARRIRAAVIGSADISFERGMRIARTELAIAQNTGTVEGYRITGVQEIEWLAYSDGRSGDRHHERMNGERIQLGGYFKLPSGAHMRYPGDPMGPVGDLVHCRCSTAPVKAGSKPKPAPPPREMSATVPGFGQVDFDVGSGSRVLVDVPVDALASQTFASLAQRLKEGEQPTEQEQRVKDAIDRFTYSISSTQNIRDPARLHDAERVVAEQDQEIIASLARAPMQDPQPIFRGLALAAGRDLKPGDTFDAGQISSWATTEHTANRFAAKETSTRNAGNRFLDPAERVDHRDTVLRLKQPIRGTNISAVSDRATRTMEDEVLSGGRLRIVGSHIETFRTQRRDSKGRLRTVEVERLVLDVEQI